MAAPPEKKAPNKSSWLIAGLLGLLAVIVFMPADEPFEMEDHVNRVYHEDLGKNQIKKVDSSGARSVVTSIEVSNSDLSSIDGSVRSSIQSGDPAIASDSIMNAQGPNVTMAKPVLDEKIADGLASGDLRLYQISLYDSMHEDGDVVDILVNGANYASVSLRTVETTIVIPLPASGGGSVQMRAAVDGGGGVTVGCRTGSGQFFTAVMTPGEMTALIP